MRIVVLLTGMAIGFLGCVHSRVLTNVTPSDSLAQINRDFAGTSAQIKLGSGDYVKARLVRLGEDSLIYTLHSGSPPAAFPNAVIERVIVHDRRRGLIEGLEWGAGIGAFLGAGVGFVFGSMNADCDDCPPSNRMTPAEGLLYGAIAGAVPGAGLGMFLGGTGRGGTIMQVRYRFPVNKAQK